MTLLPLAASLPPAAATGDESPPVLVALAANPSSVDTSTGSAMVTFTARFTDDASGVSPDGTVVTLRSPSGTQPDVVGQFALQSGTTKDGVWEAIATLPQHAERGAWKFSVRVVDASGKDHTYSSADLQAAGFPYQILQTDGLTAPARPTLVTATGGDRTATVSWTPPASDGGSPITGYVVTAYIGVLPLTPTAFNSTATTQLITALTNGTSYRFRVQAVNAIGVGERSAASNSVTPSAPATVSLGGTMAGGLHHSCALAGGGVDCWGANFAGQLGDGTSTGRTTRGLVPGLSGAVGLTAGDLHTCALLDSGTVRCWGSNAYGQLGDGTTTTRLTPTAVPGLAGVTAISASKYHSCALLAAGTVRCWGYNGHGEAGDGTTISRRSPVSVAGLTGVASITTGSWHTCARLTAGTLKCWGSNNWGQLGDGTRTARHTPRSVTGLTGASAVEAVGSSTCAIISQTVRCWGLNHHGQLGDGTAINSSTPVPVVGLVRVTSLAGGLYHACARETTGVVRCWGYASYGQLGSGSLTQRSTPKSVTGLTGAAEIAAGTFHTLARLSTGELRSWGDDRDGQLGDGGTTKQSVPVAVVQP